MLRTQQISVQAMY